MSNLPNIGHATDYRGVPTKKDVLVKLGQRHNSFYLLLHDYEGKLVICGELMEAIDKRLEKEYGEHRWKTFDSIKIIERVIT